ncbi:hypothetical protein R3P38DRAFT_3197152 [Favolaschia claudopus]|uniref:F-box domain-containing protein n=1 Tax=Favolaschia claudopus TaxID=2862362 RepID=A0AAW0B956_9AGAR
MSQFPPEIIEEIMLDAIQTHSSWLDLVDQRLQMSLVCRDWGTIATNFPSLWTSMTIRTFSSVKLLRLCVKNAKLSKLSITLDIRHTEKANWRGSHVIVKSRTPDEMEQMLADALAPASDRVEELVIQGGRESETRQIIKWMVSYDWPTLHSITLSATLCDTRGQSLTFANIHDISRLRIERMHPLQNAQALHQKITELHLDQTTHRHGGWARLATVLEECARLASLTMIQLALAESDNHRRVKLLTLRKLMIHFTEDTGISFMGNLEAPNLITLDIAAMGRGKLLDAVDANPGVFETCEEITLLQRTDVVESTTSALRAMQQVRTLDIGYCGPGAVESLKMFVQEGRQLSRLERVQCGGIFDEEAMELIVKGQFSDRFAIEQNGRRITK